MSVEIRPITAEELPTWLRVGDAAFGWVPAEEEIANARQRTELGRNLAAVEEGRIVGTAGAFSFRLTVPGPAEVPAAGITAVGVLPTHRRRGVMTALMRQQLADIRDRGEPLAILYASEAPIYGRFGYGLATTQGDLHLDPSRARLTRGTQPAGTIVLMDPEEAARAIPDIFDRFRRQIPGQIARDPAYWERWFRDPEADRDGASARFYAVSMQGDAHLGYCAYRVKADWPGGIAGSVARVADLVATTPEAYAALWEYCLQLDLIARVEVSQRPLDEPVRWMLSDPRRLRIEGLGDSLWARLVDIPAALMARRYREDGTLTVEVHDPFWAQNSGRYRLEGGPDGAECRRTHADVDLSLQVDDLGALYLGGVSAGTLARAGRIVVRSERALRCADIMFGSNQAPWCSTHF